MCSKTKKVAQLLIAFAALAEYRSLDPSTDVG